VEAQVSSSLFQGMRISPRVQLKNRRAEHTVKRPVGALATGLGEDGEGGPTFSLFELGGGGFFGDEKNVNKQELMSTGLWKENASLASSVLSLAALQAADLRQLQQAQQDEVCTSPRPFRRRL
jgi:hypothetical protein